jgi:hypothetical protein
MMYSHVDNSFIKLNAPIEEITESELRSQTTDIYRLACLLFFFILIIMNYFIKIWVHTVPVGSLAGYQEITISLEKMCSPTIPNKRLSMLTNEKNQRQSIQGNEF